MMRVTPVGNLRPQKIFVPCRRLPRTTLPPLALGVRTLPGAFLAGGFGGVISRQMASVPNAAPIPEALLRELFESSQAASFGLEPLEFARALAEVAGKFSAAPSASSGGQREFFINLRLEEFALARACALGRERAWEIFLTRYRAKLYEMARAVTREESSARELADSIYAELYGLEARDGKRRAKLLFYYGRGSLEGWLRTVLAQEWVNRYRKTKRNVSLEEQQEAGTQFAQPAVPESPSGTSRALTAAIDTALGRLNPEARYLLAAYHLDGRTLLEIAGVLGVHESTISRRLERIAAALRKDILEALVKAGQSRRQAEEALTIDVRDLAVDVRGRLR